MARDEADMVTIPFNHSFPHPYFIFSPICREELTDKVPSISELTKLFSSDELRRRLQTLEVALSSDEEDNQLAFLFHKHLTEKQESEQELERQYLDEEDDLFSSRSRLLVDSNPNAARIRTRSRPGEVQFYFVSPHVTSSAASQSMEDDDNNDNDRVQELSDDVVSNSATDNDTIDQPIYRQNDDSIETLTNLIRSPSHNASFSYPTVHPIRSVSFRGRQQEDDNDNVSILDSHHYSASASSNSR